MDLSSALGVWLPDPLSLGPTCVSEAVSVSTITGIWVSLCIYLGSFTLLSGCSSFLSFVSGSVSLSVPLPTVSVDCVSRSIGLSRVLRLAHVIGPICQPWLEFTGHFCPCVHPLPLCLPLSPCGYKHRLAWRVRRKLHQQPFSGRWLAGRLGCNLGSG